MSPGIHSPRSSAAADPALQGTSPKRISATVSRGKFVEVRLALGAVAPTPIRGRKVEESLKGNEVNDQNIARAAALIQEEVKPISDVRASAEYRREMSSVLTRRVLEQAGRGGNHAGAI